MFLISALIKGRKTSGFRAVPSLTKWGARIKASIVTHVSPRPKSSVEKADTFDASIACIQATMTLCVKNDSKKKGEHGAWKCAENKMELELIAFSWLSQKMSGDETVCNSTSFADPIVWCWVAARLKTAWICHFCIPLTFVGIKDPRKSVTGRDGRTDRRTEGWTGGRVEIVM